jgi:hypothetical protein
VLHEIDALGFVHGALVRPLKARAAPRRELRLDALADQVVALQ